MYLTIHVAQEMELDHAERTGIRLVAAVGEEAGRVAAEGQYKSTAASQLLPKYCAIIPKPLFHRSSFFNCISWNFAAAFFLCFQAAAATASLKWASLWARVGRHPLVQASFSSQRSVCCASSHSRTKPLNVTALRHRTSVTRLMCSVSCVMSAGDSKVSLPSGAARGALRFQRNGVRVDPVEQPKAQPLDLAQAPLHAPSPFCIPLVQHVEEPDAHDGVGVDYAALRVAAPGLVFNQCSGGGWLGRLERHKGADVGDLLVCERSVMLSPSRHHPAAADARAERVPRAAASWGVQRTAPV